MGEASARSAAVFQVSPSSRIVHDLHGPLTVIRDLCASLSRDELSHDRLRAIDMIDREALRLVDGLRGLAGVPVRGVVERIDLGILAESVIARFAATAEHRGVRVVARSDAGPVWVDGDAKALERALENLVQNGLRHCSGRVEVVVRQRSGWAVVRVRDDGMGIPPEDRRRIFRAGDRGGSPRGEGQGLGLAIATDIAEAHGGRLSLDSVGAGASFRLCLPRAAVPDGHPRAA